MGISKYKVDGNKKVKFYLTNRTPTFSFGDVLNGVERCKITAPFLVYAEKYKEHKCHLTHNSGDILFKKL